MKERLLMIVPHLSTGGLPQYTLKKLEMLTDTYNVMLVEYNHISNLYTIQRDKIINNLNSNFVVLEVKEHILDIIQQFKPNIISFEEFSETFIDESILSKIYKPFYEREYLITETTHTSNYRNKTFLPDKFLFVCEFSYNQYKHLNVPSAIIEYPIDYKVSTTGLAKASLGFNPQQKHILHVGLFNPYKNQSYIIEIAEKMPDYIFHFVGNQAPNFEKYWAPLVEKNLPNVIFHGEKDNVSDYIQACDLFLFPSTHELNPLVLKEVLEYNKEILMFDLPVYLNKYKETKNISYLSGVTETDILKIKEIVNVQ
jgi:glycosyltransferase involved in cell wall biosynthesis